MFDRISNDRTHLHLVPRLRVSVVMLPFRHTPIRCAEVQLDVKYFRIFIMSRSRLWWERLWMRKDRMEMHHFSWTLKEGMQLWQRRGKGLFSVGDAVLIKQVTQIRKQRLNLISAWEVKNVFLNDCLNDVESDTSWCVTPPWRWKQQIPPKPRPYLEDYRTPDSRRLWWEHQTWFRFLFFSLPRPHRSWRWTDSERTVYETTPSDC